MLGRNRWCLARSVSILSKISHRVLILNMGTPRTHSAVICFGIGSAKNIECKPILRFPFPPSWLPGGCTSSNWIGPSCHVFFKPPKICLFTVTPRRIADVWFQSKTEICRVCILPSGAGISYQLFWIRFWLFPGLVFNSCHQAFCISIAFHAQSRPVHVALNSRCWSCSSSTSGTKSMSLCCTFC